MESLPNEVVVRIGLSVAKLCGLRDFVRFATASKRHKKLLVDSPMIFPEVVRCRTQRLLMMDLASGATTESVLKELDIKTLEELAFLECYYCSCSQHPNPYDPQAQNIWDKDKSIRQVLAVVSDVLRGFPSITISLDSHHWTPAGSTTEENPAQMLYQSRCFARFAQDQFSERLGISGEFIPIRCWGDTLAKAGDVPDPDHPLTIRGNHLAIEVCLHLPRKPTMDGDSHPPGSEYLELPPRADHYATASVPSWQERQPGVGGYTRNDSRLARLGSSLVGFVMGFWTNPLGL